LDQGRNGSNVIGLYTFSKIFCPGIRVGFTIGAKEVIEKHEGDLAAAIMELQEN